MYGNLLTWIRLQEDKKDLSGFFGPAIALVIAAIAIEHEASKVPKCPSGYVRNCHLKSLAT